MTTVLTLAPKDAQALADATAQRARAEEDLYLIVRKQYALVRRAMENGGTLREVAEIVGISHQMVAKIVKGQ